MNKDTVFTISSQKQFEKIALQTFRFQYENNKVYKQFCDLTKVDVAKVKNIQNIPFLPISFFKTHQVIKDGYYPEIVFSSSGTTGMVTSQHLVANVSWYETSFRKGFSDFYGNIEDYTILALLPSYLERSGSSLIYMVKDLIALSNNVDSDFYLNNLDALIEKLLDLEKNNKNVILFGVTYALLDLVEKRSFKLKSTIIMETGGMKGKRPEMIREQLHAKLCGGFGVETIHSEYGMTELLSQAYSLGNGIFECPNTMQVLIRDTQDPLTYVPNGKSGGINVIDLANINSCSFIATQDLGKKYDNNTFEVVGRFDNSDIRGCNLMVV